MKYIILVLAFAAAQAIATGKHGPKDHTPRTPDIKTPGTPAASKAPEPRQSRTEPDHDRPCERQEIKPYWCPRP